MYLKRFVHIFRLTILVAALSWGSGLTPVKATAASYSIAILQAGQNSPTPQKKPEININLFGKNLNLTLDVGMLGLIVILALAALLVTAILLALTARRRTRQAVAANRKLQEEITQRKLAEVSLLENQQRTDAIIKSAIDGIVTMDHQGQIVDFNPAAERIFGHRRSDVIGRELAGVIIPPDLREQHRRGLAHYLATGQGPVLGKRIEITGCRADGSLVLLELSIARMPGSELPMFTGFVRDITELRKVEEARTRLAAIVESSDDAIISKTLDGIISSWNRGAETLFGYSARAAVGKSIAMLIPADRANEESEILARIARGEDVGDYETVRVGKEGQQIDVSVSISSIKDTHGKVIGASNIARGIGERKRAEREIRRLNEELEQRVADRTAQLHAANQELEAFSYSVSHDLRAPLRHINGFSQALLEDHGDKLDEEGKTYLREVRNASQEMSQLIDDVLQLAKVTRSEMHRDVVNLSEVANTVVAELQERDPSRTVTVHIEPGLSTHGDKRLLKIMLSNLLGNAWKFTSKEERAEITLGCEQRDSEIVYFVRDNGAGFDMTYVNKLFGAFQRLHTAGEFEGTGIGLATVKRIISRHGGRVWAAGTVNAGATFSFTLANFNEAGNGEKSDLTG